MELESRPDANVVSDLEQNQIFQSTYKETRKIKSNKMHANGYLARYPTRKELLSEDYQRKLQQEEALIESFGRLQDRLEAQEVEREAERQEHRRQLEQMNGGTMANIHIKGTFAATVDISLLIRMSSNSCLCLTHYYVLSYLLVFSFSLTLGVFC